MKKTLLLLFACLFGALGGVKAYTVDDLTAAGWTEVTSTETLSSGANDNVYVLVDAGASTYFVTRGANLADRPKYVSLSNPFVTPGAVWTLESRGTNKYAMQNVSSHYYLNSSANGYDDFMDASWTNSGTFDFAYSDAKWDITNSSVVIGQWSPGQYMGPWDGGSSVTYEQNVACNKDKNNAPGFKIYSISRSDYAKKYLKQTPNLTAPVDVTFLIVNPNIYQGGAATDLPTGWVNFGEPNVDSDGKFTDGTGDSKLYAKKTSKGNLVSDDKQTLYFDYYQTIANLSGGKYKSKANTFNPGYGDAYLYLYTTTDFATKMSGKNSWSSGKDETPFVDVSSNASFNVGIKANFEFSAYNTTHTSIARADDFELQVDPYLSTMATEFNNGVEMTAGLWYHFEVFKPGKHVLTATNLDDIIYATGETTALSAAGSSKFSELQTLNANTHYYIRSSSKNTLTITPCISTVAEELPDNGAMTAGDWYYFDIATAGHYDVVAASLGNIVYTTNGDLAEDASVASKFSVKNNNLSATRYYVKSSSAQTLKWFLTDDKDCTGYIKNPSFDEAISDANWTLTSGAVEYWSVFERVATGGVEEYNRPTIKCEQTITNLPSGVYKVTVQGYYRGGGGGYTEDARNAKLFANDEEVDLMSINDYKGITTPPGVEGATWQHINNSFYVPDNTVAANYAINMLNQYNNEVTVAVSDGTLTIGVKKDAAVGSDWTYFDNFTLTYTGPYNEVVESGETQTYEGTFTEDVDLTPTVECPIVDITGATFTGDITAHFGGNPNGIIYATSAQKIDMDSKAGGPVQNVISSAYNVCERLVITDGYSFVAPFDFEATHATYSRTVGASTNFGTICVPFALTSNEDIQYYTTDQITGGVLKLIEVDNVAAGTPAIFKKKNSGATSISVHTIGTAIEKDAGSQGESVRLVGKFERYVVGDEGGTTGTAANGNYFISSDVFYEGADYIIVKPFRAYLETVGVSQSRLTLQIDDETTAINELKTLDEKLGLKDGKYLIGGKIIVVKEGQQFNVNGVINK